MFSYSKPNTYDILSQSPWSNRWYTGTPQFMQQLFPKKESWGWRDHKGLKLHNSPPPPHHQTGKQGICITANVSNWYWSTSAAHSMIKSHFPNLHTMRTFTILFVECCNKWNYRHWRSSAKDLIKNTTENYKYLSFWGCTCHPTTNIHTNLRYTYITLLVYKNIYNFTLKVWSRTTSLMTKKTQIWLT